MKKFFLFPLIFTFFIGQTQNPLLSEDYSKQNRWVDSIYNNLDLEEKIGQLITVWVATKYGEDEIKHISKLIEDYKLGGLIFSLGDIKSQAKAINKFQKQSKVPLLISMDAEWGIGMRLDDAFSFPYNMTLGAIENDSLIYSISLKEILLKVKYDESITDKIYLNHIAWSPNSKKLITIFNFENKKKNKRMVYPVLINLETKKIDFLHTDGSFSHHTFISEDRILAYLKLKDHYCYGLWSQENGWKEIKNSMPKFDGHPTYINSSDKVVVDSYSDRFGIMSLYIGSINPDKKLEKIASVINNPQYKGAIRCDLHPRVSLKHNLIVCDLPMKSGRKILVVKDVLNKS